MRKSETHIKPPTGFSIGWNELWQYRELFYFFTWRDIKVKYKQTILGVLWALLQPLGMMLIFTFLFSRTWPIDTGTVRYPIFVLAGLICWNLFNSSVTHASESMVQNANIIKKIYFPRLIIPCSAILTSFFDFIMGFVIFLLFCLFYSQSINWTALFYFPLGIAVILLSAFGAGTFLAALNIKFRDFRYIIPFMMQVLFFASQVIYPLQSIQQGPLKYVLAMNPMNAAIELFRRPLSSTPIDTTLVTIGISSTILLFIVGIYFFRKTESYFADIA